MNTHRDGAFRHRITLGNSTTGLTAVKLIHQIRYVTDGAYFEYPEKVDAMKQRLHSDKFKEHFSQARKRTYPQFTENILI
jgi:catalase